LKSCLRGGLVLSIKEEFEVHIIPQKQAKPWILKKHYAHRMPPIQYAFGLYRKDELVGVCTFGPSVNHREHDRWKPYDLYELNRLITEDDLPKNALSYFVSRCIKLMPSPCVLISFADPNHGHYGYIYQATNWLYTGLGRCAMTRVKLKDGREIHPRGYWGDSGLTKDDVEEFIQAESGKARYYYFVGSKKDKKKMLEIIENDDLREIKPYPKGKNKNYDTGNKLYKQQRLF